MKKRLVIFCGLAISLASFASYAEVSKKDLEKVEKEVQNRTREHQKLQEQTNEVNADLTIVSQEMIKAAKGIQNNETLLSQMESELDELKTSLKNAEENFMIEDENLIKTLAALQNLALKPTEALFVHPLSPVEIIRSAMLLRETVPYLEENAQKIRDELEKIETKKIRVEKQISGISAQKKRMELEHTQMKTLVQKKSKLRNMLQQKSNQTQKEVAQLANQAKDVRELLKKLETEQITKRKKQEEERKRLAELERQKKLEEKQSADLIYTPDYNITDSASSAFVKAKGRIPLPARGQIVTSFGSEQAKGVTSKGIILKTRNLAQVTAPFDGAVMFAGEFRGYGNLVIIDHGQGYVSLLAGIETIDCELGQSLLAGEPVGQMPQNNEPKLYVELRKDSHPINPMLWMTH